MVISPRAQIPAENRGAQAIYYNDQREDPATLLDVVSLAEQWLSTNCGPTNYWCDGADWNTNGSVTLTDFARLTQKWQYNRFSGGTGTESDPYRIATVADWLTLIETQSESDVQWGRDFIRDADGLWLNPSSNNATKRHYILTADIDFEGMQISPVGHVEFDPNTNFIFGRPFGGTLDGQNHVLRNLVIDEPDSDVIGIFSWLYDGYIRNLGVENATVSGASYIGGLVGFLGGEGANSTTVTNCYFTGSVTGTGDRVGGLSGYSVSKIERSYFDGSVSGARDIGGLTGFMTSDAEVIGCFSKGQVYGTHWVGGLTGYNSAGRIESSYSSCQVEGEVWAIGGLVGGNINGKIIHCYSTGKVTPGSYPEYAGGLVGYRTTGPNYQDTRNFWDTETSIMETSWMGLGKLTFQMQDIATFQAVGWDFETVWQMPANDYPRLKWENVVP